MKAGPHLILAVLAGLASIGLPAGNMVARIVGVAPLLTLDGFVIWAIILHGSEMKSVND
jgi:hypothetical protein